MYIYIDIYSNITFKFQIHEVQINYIIYRMLLKEITIKVDNTNIDVFIFTFFRPQP